MKFKKGLISAALMVMLATTAGAEITIKTERAKEWLARHTGKELVRAKKKDGQVWRESVRWDHAGTNSLSIEERDAMAASRLYNHCQKVVADYNQNREADEPEIRFAGVRYLQNESGWSESKAILGRPRTYDCGGIAVGEVLTYGQQP